VAGHHDAGSRDRRFEAAVFVWDDAADAVTLRRLVEALSLQGFDVGIASSRALGDLDGRLGARPTGSGSLYLLVEGFGRLYTVDGDGPRLVDERESVNGKVFDEGDAAGAVCERLCLDGIAPSDVLLVDEEHGPVAAVLEDQLRRRERGELPAPASDPEWIVTVEGFDRERERAHESLLTLADGRIGTHGAPLVGDTFTSPRVLAAGVYDGAGAASHLLNSPVWNRLDETGVPPQPLVRTLDLRAGLLHESGGEELRGVRFSSIARPGTTALRAETGGPLDAGAPPLLPPPRKRVSGGSVGRRLWISVPARVGGVVAAATERSESGRVERLAAYVTDPAAAPDPEAALADLATAEELGFERLLREHRRAWAARWQAADVRIDGDPELQRDVRFALFHLMASVRESGETALGARGLSGHGYRGHVFWDTDLYSLPFFAATRPEEARTLLEYRIRRLPAARALARASGREGARFSWESARSGREVTPSYSRLKNGVLIPILTGKLEEHIVADVAWASWCYFDWTGDEEFLRGPGRDLIVETARYWASRIRLDGDGRGHIDNVIGPDEYHEGVDDNAFTNVMARWNLRRGAELLDDDRERESWLQLADRVVDGYDESTGVYEEFAGFFGLEPFIVADVAPRRPLAGELLLGRDRLHASQVVKQADVLMLHHIVPGEVAPGSLRPNLEFYEPRTTHGSSLSPGIHASLFARLGMFDRALETLRLASRMDIDDLQGTTAAGLHIATMGSLWQALAFGFAGVRPDGDALHVDPRLPPQWRSLELSLSFRGVPLTVRVEPQAVVVTADAAVRVRLEGREPLVVAGGRPRRIARPDASGVEAAMLPEP
jgi:trehalose/maltose hydrolase-like predicted phosphorylase